MIIHTENKAIDGNDTITEWGTNLPLGNPKDLNPVYRWIM